MQVFTCLALVLSVATAFYLPGVSPHDYKEGELVEMKVNKLDSIQTQLPYDYYSLPFCKPSEVTEASENLGEILAGDMIENSNYKLMMKKDETCKLLCKKTYTNEDLALFEEKIKQEYSVNWIVDNMPAATTYLLMTEDGDNEKTEEVVYQKGFFLGFVGQAEEANTKQGVAYINNHVKLMLSYHEDPKAFSGARIVGFQVEAYSHSYANYVGEAKPPQCVFSSHQPVSGELSEAEKTIFFTYDVIWLPSAIRWASRWDLYLKMTNSEIHWFSILNSIMIVLFLTGTIAMILIRTLNKDFARYNDLELTDEERAEETGWKLIHSEVFRPPAYGSMFAVLVGTGCQILAMVFMTLLFACLGFLSPANRGGLMTAFLLLFVFAGMLAGYFSTRVYKMFNLLNWRRNTLVTSLFFPGIVFAIFFLLNLVVWGEHSSGAVPFGTLVALLVLWFGISVPLVYFGSFCAMKRDAIEFPVRVNNIPRLMPTVRPFYNHPVVATAIAGVLPFGAVSIELFFIMSSVWMHQFYYVFGILAIVFVILIITVAEVCVMLIYSQLCYEDYHWWWRSFIMGSGSALYLFGYSVLYFFTKLEISKFTSSLLFFGYMFLASFTFWIMTGTIGYFACYFFIRKIYGSIKID
mmetsp:Transcript_29952/g.58714  ORF Transcript_29952/g.58714 Transcript_29952/m.58714 type:complete len:635 (-) Transcript_29952:68-1972(-)|eukprot:CAMPEP_0175139916 /NCGR_PEP_ID=MMETSP0087-20121206/11179_1 /TAXON_ID=136419 /ORGANISM="Unknown Unknown, Strain D1" /LENGTH=634 /DNA_ID=CAMNT_0016423001 /DNA_START=42 /DNA_END=1946 /DNA_ORIENTATION=+